MTFAEFIEFNVSRENPKVGIQGYTYLTTDIFPEVVAKIVKFPGMIFIQ